MSHDAHTSEQNRAALAALVQAAILCPYAHKDKEQVHAAGLEALDRLAAEAECAEKDAEHAKKIRNLRLNLKGATERADAAEAECAEKDAEIAAAHKAVGCMAIAVGKRTQDATGQWVQDGPLRTLTLAERIAELDTAWQHDFDRAEAAQAECARLRAERDAQVVESQHLLRDRDAFWSRVEEQERELVAVQSQCVCGHPESDHETVEYRGAKSRSCVKNRIGKAEADKCPCRGFRHPAPASCTVPVHEISEAETEKTIAQLKNCLAPGVLGDVRAVLIVSHEAAIRAALREGGR